MIDVINHPLSHVSDLFDNHVRQSNSSPSTFDPSSVFAAMLESPTERSKIPSLNQVNVDDISTHALVRFRCMIQDTGSGPEMFATAHDVLDPNTGSKELRSLWYMDEPFQSGDVLPEYLAERSVLYCVSPPGETLWMHRHHRLGDEDVTSAMNNLSMASQQRVSKPGVAAKYPVPNEEHVAVIVKCYKETDCIRVGQLVEFVGVLGNTVPTPISDENAETDGFSSRMDGYTGLPVLHAIAYRSLHERQHDLFTAEQLDDVRGQARDVRVQLIDYISTAFGGDQLVAEMVLLQLISRIMNAHRNQKMGHFSLNVTNFFEAQAVDKGSTSSNEMRNLAAQHVAHVLETLTTHLVTIPFTVDFLNKAFFCPRSIDEDLQAGILQLVDGTTITIDETLLTEGKLGDTGVRNVQALSNVILAQILPYAFPYSQFDFDTDLGVLSLSTSKSILPIRCSVHLEPEYTPEESGEGNQPVPSVDTLQLYRQFIHAARRGDYSIPESTSEYVQQHFVQERKTASEQKRPLLSQDDLMLRLDLARLVTLSYGESVLTKEIYDHAVYLDTIRRQRMSSSSLQHSK